MQDFNPDFVPTLVVFHAKPVRVSSRLTSRWWIYHRWWCNRGFRRTRSSTMTSTSRESSRGHSSSVCAFVVMENRARSGREHAAASADRASTSPFPAYSQRPYAGS